MKTSVWNKVWSKTVLWAALGLLLFLNAYTLPHAVTGLPILCGAGLLLFFFLFVRRLLSRRSEEFQDRFAGILWIVIPALQTAFILLLHNNIRYDAYWVLDQAVEMLDTHQFSATISGGYFTQVPNNYGLTLLLYWFLSMLKAFGLPAACYMRASQFFNLIFLDLSLLFLFLSIRKLRGRSASCFFLFFCALTPYLYIWSPYCYTSTTSMMFACAAVWIWLCIRSTSSVRRQCLLALLLGLLCITGFKVRATSLIAYIAIALFWSVRKKRDNLKKHLRPLLVFLFSAVLAFFAWKGIVAHYTPFDTTDTALPVTHFIMMGARGNGSFNMDDLRYTVSLPTAEEKLSGTLSVILERLSENGLSGNFRLLLDKLLNCWADGTDSWTAELSLCTDFNALHPYIIGSKAIFLTSYAQMFRSLQLFLVCCFCILALRQRCAGAMFLTALNLLGGMVFHLLWEASPLYSIAFALFSYALCADALTELDSLFAGRSRAYSSALAAASLACLSICAAFLFSRYEAAVSGDRLLSDFVVNQHMTTSGAEGPDMEIGEIWTQTFEADTEFSAIDLYYGNPDRETNDSLYRITLTDEYGTQFYEELLSGNDTGYDLAYRIQFEPVFPGGSTTYYLSIEAISQDSESYVSFTSQDCSRLDLYPHGTLLIDGEDTQRDLSFRVISLHLGPLATKKEYCLFALLLLLLLFSFFLKALRLVNEERRPVSGSVQSSPDVLAQQSQHHHDDAEGKEHQHHQ